VVADVQLVCMGIVVVEVDVQGEVVAAAAVDGEIELIVCYKISFCNFSQQLQRELSALVSVRNK